MDVVETMAEKLQISKNLVERLIQFVEVDECTVPFLARYRKEQTNSMNAETLREFLTVLKETREVEKKVNTIIKKVEKQGQLTKQIENSFKCAQSMEELNHLFAPFKGEQKRTLAERARCLGLEEAALKVLHNYEGAANLRDWVKKGTEGLGTLSEVEKSVKYLIADHIAKHPDTLVSAREIFQKKGITLQSKLCPVKSKEDKKSLLGSRESSTDSKYNIYFDFQCRIVNLKSYQILAINRGEAHKQLNVKLIIDTALENKFSNWCQQRWVKPISHTKYKDMVCFCVEDSYKRLIKPLILRRLRSELTKSAHMDSIDVFRRNLKKLLLTAPVRDKIVLGVDPGYRNGCKCAIVSGTGNDIYATFVFNFSQKEKAIDDIRRVYEKHKFELIAIGNGTACREAEKLISTFIRNYGRLNLSYCIVNENGASIYSVSKEADADMPDLDPNLRSAVSIARRLQDPLVELVRMEPKHLGVGMYQHDIPDTLMKASLYDVVEDCVTFVGVDLNVAGASLLRRIAGLKPAQVNKILKWREKHGRFINRQQLLDVPGIGAKTFQQCAGFVRIAPTSNNEMKPEQCSDSESTTSGRKRKIKPQSSKSASKKRKIDDHRPDFLDQTWIHPESYDVTRRFLSLLDLKDHNIGKPSFIARVKEAKKNLDRFVSKLNVARPSLELIVDGLVQPSGFCDVRSGASEPLYRRGITSLDDIRCGDTLRGRVVNVTDFGVFVDVGVGQDGLIHFSKIRNWGGVKESIGPNDVVTVCVIKLNKLSLSLVSHETCTTLLR